MLTSPSLTLLLETYRHTYTGLSTTFPNSVFRECICCCRRSEIIRLSKSRERAKGTCDWISGSNKFVNWRNKTENSILWISGSAGAGKSTLCSAILDVLETQRCTGEILAYYFIDGRFKNANHASGILGMLAIKMLLSPSLRESRDNLKTFLNDLDAVGGQLSSSQIREFLLRISHNISSEETLFLVIDGVDDIEDSQSIIDLVREIVNLVNGRDPSHSLRLCISSEPESFCRRYLQGSLELHIDGEVCVQNDVIAYSQQSILEMELSNLSLGKGPPVVAHEKPSKVWRAVRGPFCPPISITPFYTANFRDASIRGAADAKWDELYYLITPKITEGAKGMFLWVSLVLEEIPRTIHTCDSVEELVESSKIGDCFAIYQYKIGKIHEKDRPVALQMIRWVQYAARPLHSWELVHAINLQLGVNLIDADILRICRGLLKMSGGRMISLVHLSFRKYLESLNCTNDALGWSAVSEASNEIIAQTCLKTLEPELLLESLTSWIPDYSLSSAANGTSKSLHSYAFSFWKFHYNLAERKSSCLPGMLHEILHEMLRQTWAQRKVIVDSKTSSEPSTFERESHGSFSHPLNSSIPTFSVNLGTALREGARFGMVKLVKLELEMGGNPNIADPCGRTALHFAASTGNLAIMRLLLDYGANIHEISLSGDTALSNATANGSIEAVELLLDYEGGLSDTNSGSPLNRSLRNSAQITLQRLSLVTFLSENCAKCGNLESHYIVSMPLGIVQPDTLHSLSPSAG